MKKKIGDLTLREIKNRYSNIYSCGSCKFIDNCGNLCNVADALENLYIDLDHEIEVEE